VWEQHKPSAARRQTGQHEQISEHWGEAQARDTQGWWHVLVAPESLAMESSPQATPTVPVPPAIKLALHQGNISTQCATWWCLYRECQV
jgi:hypothetical protein